MGNQRSIGAELHTVEEKQTDIASLWAIGFRQG
jgi:hypothetical protein